MLDSVCLPFLSYIERFRNYEARGDSLVTFGVADLSWLMHKNARALALAVVREEDGRVVEVPTGHVYGTLRDVMSLSSCYDVLVLAVDSIAADRREMLPSYKAGRKARDSSSSQPSYNIYRDLDNILALCTSVPNVWFLREDGYEADDLIASYISLSAVSPSYRISVYHNDNDILQTPGRYDWYSRLSSAPVDRVAYISRKYGFPEGSVDYLPLLVKMVRGDASDSIPAAVPRLPTDLLVRACLDAGYGVLSFGDYRDALLRVAQGGFPKWADRLSPLSDGSSEMCQRLRLNYNVVRPKLLGRDSIRLRKAEGDARALMDYYRISSLSFIGCGQASSSF